MANDEDKFLAKITTRGRVVILITMIVLLKLQHDGGSCVNLVPVICIYNSQSEIDTLNAINAFNLQIRQIQNVHTADGSR